MAARAETVRPSGPWEHDPFAASAGGRWRGLIGRHKSAFGFALAASLLVFGWITRDRGWLSAEHGLGYALGFVSVACILVLLLYPLRKRYKWLRFIGPLPKWFRNHMLLGVSAPIAALYHCGYQLGSLNSRIALFSALTVAGSGLIGRFIYAKVHHGLYGRKATLKELLAQVRATSPGLGKMGTFFPELSARLSRFDREVLVPPDGMLDCIRLPFVLAVKTRVQQYRLRRFTRVSLTYLAKRSPIVAEHKRDLQRVVGRHIDKHLRQVRRVAEFTAYDRLLALWHKVHFPFFVLLFISVTVHVAVVHLY